MKGVILAAGNGSRLGNLTANVPKSLLDIAGRPLIDYTIDAMKVTGVEEFIIVTGYLGDTLEDDLRDRRADVSLTFVRNPDYQRANGYSLRRARRAIGDSAFLLAMADHMLSEALLTRLQLGAGGHDAVAVDYSPKDFDTVAEATRVLVHEDFVVAISKDLDPWSGLDAGAFHLTPLVFEAMDDIPDDSQLSAILQRHIALGCPLRAVDVSGAFWMDVDTVADYNLAQSLIAGDAQPVV
ncbi:MAG TPA: NTP transferase domain-containing protein [Dehalococcoidia bacterium]|nr:NTP transferase domain-containing protein [Dehalococcoidia bacterium]